VNPLQTLSQTLSVVERKPPSGSAASVADLDVYGGHESKTAADNYRWVGDQRGQNPLEPTILIQYTFSGFGIFEDESHFVKVTPGQAFTAIIPSKHVYYLPQECPRWTYFWVMIRHPYIVQRIARLHRTQGPLIVASPESEFVQRMVDLFLGSRHGTDDRFSAEQKLFNFLIALDRAMYAMEHPATARDQLLREISRLMKGDSMSHITVDDLALSFGASRSNFSHHFRAVTGFTPAAYLRDLRLERARDMLLDSETPLKTIARMTGFADNNHFTKAFRRRFGFTPGAFRAQLRS
jgi:AraC-like DNA-binding protein